MCLIVNCKLCWYQPFKPVFLSMIYEELEILFQLLIYIFHLSICLGVEWYWQLYFNPQQIFNFLVISAANCKSLFNIILSDSLYNFHTLFLNNLINLFTNVLSVVSIKCVILDNLLQTTRTASFCCSNHLSQWQIITRMSKSLNRI